MAPSVKDPNKHLPPSLNYLAHAIDRDRTYASRMLRLASLAPDIIKATLRGEEPNGISLEKLRRDLPVVWAEQGERWGRGQ